MEPATTLIDCCVLIQPKRCAFYLAGLTWGGTTCFSAVCTRSKKACRKLFPEHASFRGTSTLIIFTNCLPWNDSTVTRPFSRLLSMSRTNDTEPPQICPRDQQILHPFQSNIIIEVPGQTVALHLDLPYFWGATRAHVPRWLLTTMVGSGLFQDRFIPQVQIVGYVHRWNDTDRGGDFVFWDENTPEYKTFPSTALGGSALDGSKLVHTADLYMRNTPLPIFSKEGDTVLTYKGDDTWVIVSNGNQIASYKTNDLRSTIVYRALCFASVEERTRFLALPEEEVLPLETILETFRADLEKRKLWNGPITDHLKFALKLLDVYQPLPLAPFALFPYNYCALEAFLAKVPGVSALLALLC
mmetsp:Transcript_26797/g.63743  ORF Transcript_26797/g.63743 Transcript_26797/m.63743 type:complete len:357 (+) Transcript_26797:273-1343(+)